MSERCEQVIRTGDQIGLRCPECGHPLVIHGAPIGCAVCYVIDLGYRLAPPTPDMETE